MKLFKLFFILVFSGSIFAQAQLISTYPELALQAEEDYSSVITAKQLAMRMNLPLSIYTENGVMIEVIGIKDGQPLYGVISNLSHPMDGATTVLFPTIKDRYDLSTARVYYGNGVLTNPNLGLNFSVTNRDELLLIPESSNDRVMLFSAIDGTLIDALAIDDPTNLSTPIQANLTPWGNITVSDQISDAIAEYDIDGNFLNFFAASGASVPLDNMRGHTFKPDNGNLVVGVASGTNSDAVMEFDQTGAYLGNFIEPNSAIMDGPFSIIFRTNDVLVTASTSDAVHRFDLSGTYLDNLVPSINFPEQIAEFPNGDLGVAGFSVPSAVYIYDSNGVLLTTFDAVTGVRGVYKLGNGNILTTNGAGVFILDGATGAVVDNPVAGVSGRFISYLDDSVIPVELTSFSANVSQGSVELVWNTATETNNSGFEIQRSSDAVNYRTIGFVDGMGTTQETNSYTFTDEPGSGLFYYRLKQIDYDGSATYSITVMADLGLPEQFSLKQNYPNPFNPSTTIQFSIPEMSNVKLSVFTILGEEVETLIDGVIEAGIHKINFDASDLNSGLYIYQLNAHGKTFTRKMMLMK